MASCNCYDLSSIIHMKNVQDQHSNERRQNIILQPTLQLVYIINTAPFEKGVYFTKR
jgi:hypothetical protein